MFTRFLAFRGGEDVFAMQDLHSHPMQRFFDSVMFNIVHYTGKEMQGSAIKIYM